MPPDSVRMMLMDSRGVFFLLFNAPLYMAFYLYVSISAYAFELRSRGYFRLSIASG